ncbi:D-amino acid dehydrogenase small subunit [compost metagenome]
MDIRVVGAGIVGLSSAWFLSKAGHRVTVIDQATGPGMGASAGNGAQLSCRCVVVARDPRHAVGSQRAAEVFTTMEPCAVALVLGVSQCMPHVCITRDHHRVAVTGSGEQGGARRVHV